MALDLSREFPRSAFEQLEGFAWLPRLIDKLHAAQAGNLGEYGAYPCPGDRQFLKAFGLDAEELKAQVLSGADEASIAQWVQSHAKHGSPEHKQAYLMRLHDSGPMLAWVARLYAFSLKPTISLRSPGVSIWSLNTFAKVTAAEEGHPIPAPPPLG